MYGVCFKCKMMYKYIYLFVLIFSTFYATAQKSKIDQDKEAIKSMCGCYSISFDYAETFSSDTSYKIHEPYRTGASAEWVFVAEENKDKITLQHLLVVMDTIVIKHWRQDWVYQNTDIYMYDNSRSWSFLQFKEEDVKGQWTQKVFQVDDSPRYEGSATWVHIDGKHYWENTTDAPLPRREYTKRSDYNVMKRTNRLRAVSNVAVCMSTCHRATCK